MDNIFAKWPVLVVLSGRQFVRICGLNEWSSWLVFHGFHLFLVDSFSFFFSGFWLFSMVFGWFS